MAGQDTSSINQRVRTPIRWENKFNATVLVQYFAPDLCSFLWVMKEDVFSFHLAKVTPFIVCFWTLGTGPATDVLYCNDNAFFYLDVLRSSLTV
jgi:hypothetical protein